MRRDKYKMKKKKEWQKIFDPLPFDKWLNSDLGFFPHLIHPERLRVGRQFDSADPPVIWTEGEMIKRRKVWLFKESGPAEAEISRWEGSLKARRTFIRPESVGYIWTVRSVRTCSELKCSQVDFFFLPRFYSWNVDFESVSRDSSDVSVSLVGFSPSKVAANVCRHWCLICCKTGTFLCVLHWFQTW